MCHMPSFSSFFYAAVADDEGQLHSYQLVILMHSDLNMIDDG
jgi:hypothetical protein